MENPLAVFKNMVFPFDIVYYYGVVATAYLVALSFDFLSFALSRAYYSSFSSFSYLDSLSLI
jgi:hypothetical protein